MLENKLEFKKRPKAAASAGLAGFVGGPPDFPRDGMRVGSNGERVPFGRPLGVLRPATYEEPAAVRFHRGEKLPAVHLAVRFRRGEGVRGVRRK